MGDVLGWFWFLIPLGVGVVALREYRFAKACLAASGLLLAGKAVMELRDGSMGIGWRALVVFIVCGTLGVLVQLSWWWVDRKRSEDEKSAITSTMSSKGMSSQPAPVTRHQPESTAPPQPQSDALPGIRDSIGVMLSPSERGIPKQLSFTTGGVGKEGFSFDVRPRKLMFESPTSTVDEKDLPRDIEIDGKRVTVVTFTDHGFILDDHHIQVSGKATLLDAAPAGQSIHSQEHKPSPQAHRKPIIVGVEWFSLVSASIPSSGRAYVLQLWPVPTKVGGGGLGQVSGPPGTKLNFPGMMFIQEIKLTNYSGEPLFNTQINLGLTFREAIKDPSQPGVSRSGAVTLSRSWPIVIQTINSGIDQPFTFYVENISNQFVDVSFPDSAVAQGVDQQAHAVALSKPIGFLQPFSPYEPPKPQ